MDNPQPTHPKAYRSLYLRPLGKWLGKKGGYMKAQEWNNIYSVGQSICLTEDDGSITATQTKSQAWELGHGQAVIKVDGKRGGYSLDRIKAR